MYVLGVRSLHCFVLQGHSYSICYLSRSKGDAYPDTYQVLRTEKACVAMLPTAVTKELTLLFADQ